MSSFLCLFLIPFLLYSQSDTLNRTKYSNDYIFKNGIYLSYWEFKIDSPSIRDYFLKKPSISGDPNYKRLEYVCNDSSKTVDYCTVNECWGYTDGNDVYISHEYFSYFFKLMVIGSVCHFTGLSGIGSTATDIITGFGGDNEYKQFFLDFETGDVQLFNYRYFSAFLKAHDDELYQELILQKKKRKIIFKYLLKYNEKHPVYF